MNIFSDKSIFSLAISSVGACTSIFLSCSAASANPFTIGDDLINRSTDDTADGSIFIVPDSFGSTTKTLLSWSIFDDDVSGRSITPLILEDLGSNQYSITGIGTTRTSDASGIQSFNFDLVSGSADVGEDLYFGWKDGGNGSNNLGVIDYENVSSDSIIWLGGEQTSFSVGQTFPGSSSLELERSYSVQATAVPFGTSPTSGIFILGGIFGISRLKKNLAKKK